MRSLDELQREIESLPREMQLSIADRIRDSGENVIPHRTWDPGREDFDDQLDSGIKPVIDKTRGICGGCARIVSARIPIWAIEQLRRSGMPNDEILATYSKLTPQDLLHARTYTALHPDEIDRDIREHEEA